VIKAIVCGLMGCAAAVTAAGCLEAIAPEVGPPAQELCLDVDSDPDRPVRFRADIVDTLFAREEIGCHECHRPAAPTPIGFEVGGLDLSEHATLLAGGVVSRSDIVIPGRPCESILFQKVGVAPPFGGRMPLKGPPFLTEEERGLIHDWIAEGALDN
jgi:hypothetical protein